MGLNDYDISVEFVLEYACPECLAAQGEPCKWKVTSPYMADSMDLFHESRPESTLADIAAEGRGELSQATALYAKCKTRPPKEEDVG